MITRTRQKGITALGLVFVLVVLGIFGYVGLKMVPVYLQSFKIDTAMKNLMHDGDIQNMSKDQIARGLVRRLDINQVELITERNWKNYLQIETGQGQVSLDVIYTRKVPLFGNLSLVADFHKHVQN